MKLKKKTIQPAPAQKIKPKKVEIEAPSSPDYCEKFKGELYGPLPAEVDSIDLRNPSPHIVQVSRTIYPCRLVFQHNLLTLTLPFRGYYKEAYEKEIKKLFDQLAKLEKDLKVHFAGIIHADDEKPKIKQKEGEEVKEELTTREIPFTKKLKKFKLKVTVKPAPRKKSFSGKKLKLK